MTEFSRCTVRLFELLSQALVTTITLSCVCEIVVSRFPIPASVWASACLVPGDLWGGSPLSCSLLFWEVFTVTRAPWFCGICRSGRPQPPFRGWLHILPRLAPRVERFSVLSAGKPPAALRLGGQPSERDLGPVSHGRSGTRPRRWKVQPVSLVGPAAQHQAA